MTDFYIGQISMFSFNFPPKSWAQCNGQIVSIAQNTALFSLLGTTYGGNGQTTFALPDLRGRVPLGAGNSGPSPVALGQVGGAENVTLTAATMPGHTHALNATTAVANKRPPVGRLFAADNATVAEFYAVPGTTTTLSPQSMSNVGGGQPHTNMQPYSVINFCIALYGIFPSRN